MSVVGWDIGGVNTKVALVVDGDLAAVRQRPFELQRAPASLVSLLRELASGIGADGSAVHAVTLTAELSQLFRTKREGVGFVLDAVEAAFPCAQVRVFTAGGLFVPVADARREPLAVAAANWAATASFVARHHRDVLLVDVGTTTTDVIPIVGGRVSAAGRTDPERLASGELVYTGVLRTPVEAIVSEVSVQGVPTGVSAEGFALSGDVHLWRGDLREADYTVAAPDNRPATREYAGERIARIVCADRDLLDERALSDIADAVARAQVGKVTSAISRVRSRHPELAMAVVTGLGAPLGIAAAHAAGLLTTPLSGRLGHDGARCAPAAAVALLLDEQAQDAARTHASRSPGPLQTADDRPRGLVDVVVKLGGGLLTDPGCFDSVVAQLGTDLRGVRALIVPGGGPFADAVRAADRQLQLGDDTAHWMAVMAMDQFARVIASRLIGARLVERLQEAGAALLAGRLPVLAPYRWLREVDPLPHTWAVTSDSIAAWVAGVTGARRLVLIKPPGARGDRLVDDHFEQARPAGAAVAIVAADEPDLLHHAVRDAHPRRDGPGGPPL